MQADLIQLINAYRAALSTEATREALAAVFDCINPRIYLYFLGRVSDPDAQDLRSNTLLQIRKGLNGFKGTTSEAAWGWCFTIAKRQLGDFFEQKEKSITETMDPGLLSELEGASSGDAPIKLQDLKVDMSAALESLRDKDPDCFFVLWDYFMVGKDYEELARKIDKSVDAVRMQISRCTGKLAPFLK